MTSWDAVRAEHLKNVGFREGPGDRNPWTEEMGAGDAAYCVAAATIVAHHSGVQWGADAQFGDKGFAYCPYLWNWAAKHGYARPDHTSQGRPAAAKPGDIYLWDWDFDGVADHAETAITADAGGDGLVHGALGYNTGSPEGCYSGIVRPRKYLLGVVDMAWAYAGAPAPMPPPQPPAQVGPPWPGRVLRYPPFTTSPPGGDVWAWQEHMRLRGWNVTVDGVYGPASKGACISFQQEKRLYVDGEVGSETWNATWTSPVT